MKQTGAQKMVAYLLSLPAFQEIIAEDLDTTALEDTSGEVSNRDITDAMTLLRAITGKEPYGPLVYPVACHVARIVRERLVERLAELTERESGG